MKKIFSVITVLLFAFYAPSFAVPNRVFASYFGGTGYDDFLDVAFADDGTVVILGYTNSTDIVIPNGAPNYIFGTDGTVAQTPFILRLSNDGKTVLSFSRFAFGTFRVPSKADNLRLAVTNNGIYMVGAAYSSFASIPNFDGKIDNVPGTKPAIARISLDGSTVLNATYLGGGDSGYDINDIDIFPNGDLCVNHDKSDSNTDYLSRIKPDLSGYVWNISYYTWTGKARTNAVSVSPQGDLVYVGGYAMGHTGLEPYKDPFLFCYSGDGQTQYWKRGTDANDYGVYNFPQATIGINRLISDSQIYSLATDSLGNALTAAYTDGGATVLVVEPMYGGYYNSYTTLPASIQDGDAFSGFSGATSVGVIGRLGKDGNWIRSHRVKPAGGSFWNQWTGICPAYKNDVFYLGRVSAIPDVESWETGASMGTLIKTAMNADGTNRKFVTHLAGVDVMHKIARDRNTYRYAVVGTAKADGVVVVNGFQDQFNGLYDGYILIFDDNDKPSQVADLTTPIADANVLYGTEVAKNFGTSPSLFVKRRDSRTYETAKTYIKFDLLGITKPITDARFQIFKSGTYDAGEIIVYALKEGFETWNESTITWNNAPANVIASPWEIDKTKADSLGIWKIPVTNATATVSYQGAAFTQYVENCRLNGDKKITLVLAPSTPIDGGGTILNGASKENTTAPIKPTLRTEYAKSFGVLTELSLWPSNVSLNLGQTRQFYVNAFDQYGGAMNASATFSVSNGASISTAGLFSTSTAGTYNVTAQFGGFTATANVVVNTITDIIAPISANRSLKSYFANNNIFINAENEMVNKVEVYDIYGRKLLDKAFSSNNIQIAFQQNQGIYMVKVYCANKSYVNKVIVK